MGSRGEGNLRLVVFHPRKGGAHPIRAGVAIREATGGEQGLLDSRDWGFFVSEDLGPVSAGVDAQPFSSVAQHHGMSSSMRLLGQPLTRRVSRSAR